MKSIGAIALSLSLGTPLLAQVAGCTYERAVTVNAAWALGPVVDCDNGINVNVGGLKVRSGPKSCPLFVIITPTHEVAQPTTSATRVEFVRLEAENSFIYDCVNEYFLIFVVSSSCRFKVMRVIGAVDRLRTVPCQEVVRG